MQPKKAPGLRHCVGINTHAHVLRRLSLGFLASAISVPVLTAIAFRMDAIAEVSLYSFCGIGHKRNQSFWECAPN
jgi:hypothetical protein